MHHRKLIMVIVIATIIRTSAIRVDTNVESPALESANDPKAEALTLVIHKFPPSSRLRPIKVIDRNDDVVHVIHTSRPKRKPTSRNRRPSPNQFRSKIKHQSSGSSSNFGGFKQDFGPSDFRYPPYPSTNFGEPPRTSNKYKRGQKPSFDSFSYTPLKSKKSKKPTSAYGPPPSFNQFDNYNQEIGPAASYNRPLQTLQQQQTNFPSYSIDTVEPASSNYYNSNDRFPQPINNFPLETAQTYNSQKTSYGIPVRPSNHANFNLGPNHLGNSNSQQHSSANSNSNFPKLPSRYEPKDFSTPNRPNPLTSNGNQFLNDYTGYNDASESQQQNIQINAHNRQRQNSFNKFNNFDYDFKGQKSASSPDNDDDDDDTSADTSLDTSYLFSTRRPFSTTTTTTTTTTLAPLTTKRPKKGQFGKRKRPAKISQTHNLDTDDLRDAFTVSSDFQDTAGSNDFANFDSQRNNKRNQSPLLPHEIHSTLKTARNQNQALRSALGEDFEIVSVQKSLEKDPNEEDPFGFQRKNDNYVVGSDIRFGSMAASPPMWNGDFTNFPRNHRFS